jgi:uncharacterized cupredoxin-like copper-binding protein
MLSGRDSYVTSALFGIAIYLVGVAIITVAILTVVPDQVYFALIFGVPAAVAGFVIARFRRWGLLFGLLAAAFGLLAVSEGADIYLTTPQSFFDFGLALFSIVGLIIVLAACLAGSIQYFRHNVGEAPGRLPAALKGVAAILGVLAVISAILTVLQIEDVPAADAQGATILQAKEAKWDIMQIDAEAGGQIRIVVRNTDPILHTFTIDDLDIDERIGPWTERLIVIENPEARIYGYICRIPGHEKDMSGAIVVE